MKVDIHEVYVVSDIKYRDKYTFYEHY